MAQNEIGISEIGYDENLIIRVITDKSSKLRKRMVSGMTDDIFQKSNIWGVRRGVYCANEQFDDVRNCDHVVVGMPYKNEVW